MSVPTAERRPPTEPANHLTPSMVRSRADAAARLEPLSCGCRDPFACTHRARPVTGRQCPGLCRDFGIEQIRYWSQTTGVCPCSSGDMP